MKQKQFIPPEIKIIPDVLVPEKLYVCIARIKPEVGSTLKNAFETGKSLPENLDVSCSRHLAYMHDLSTRGLLWEVGPSADFSKILQIYSGASLEMAYQVAHKAPFSQEGVIYDDLWFEWNVHVPPWRLPTEDRQSIENLMRYVNILPSYPDGNQPSSREIRVKVVTPPKLFVVLSKSRPEAIKEIELEQSAGKPVPAYFLHHVFNRLGTGGTVQMGYDWESGPSVDQRYDLTVMSVSSLQMAQLLRENDHFSQHGLFYDHQYFEWRILMPLSKVSPIHKKTMQQWLRRAGTNLPDEE